VKKQLKEYGFGKRYEYILFVKPISI
jgi:hypothetical protein